MYDVVALGEILIDFTPAGKNSAGMQLFAQNPGGAPANVLAMNAKLGGKTAFIGKVGRDNFGAFLRRTMVDAGIDCTGLVEAEDVATTLAFVQLDEHGDRSFTFVRKPGADIMLTWDEVKTKLLNRCRLFHFGSVSLTDNPSRTATYEAARYAKSQGALISYDPNYRQMLWPNEQVAVQEMRSPLELVDILKVSEAEMPLLTDEKSLENGAKKLINQGIALVVATLGPDGSYYRTRQSSGYCKAYRVNTIDTTGAGDAFVGSLHHRLAGLSLDDINTLDETDWMDIMRFCNAAAGLTTTRYGAIPAMPSSDQIQAYLADKAT